MSIKHEPTINRYEQIQAWRSGTALAGAVRPLKLAILSIEAIRP